MANFSKFNNCVGWNNSVGWKMSPNSIILQDGIIMLDGNSKTLQSTPKPPIPQKSLFSTI